MRQLRPAVRLVGQLSARQQQTERELTEQFRESGVDVRRHGGLYGYLLDQIDDAAAFVMRERPMTTTTNTNADETVDQVIRRQADRLDEQDREFVAIEVRRNVARIVRVLSGAPTSPRPTADVPVGVDLSGIE